MRIAIVGGGAAGTLLALALMRLPVPPRRIDLVDRAGAFGRGLAYAAPGMHHRINVPAHKMGGLAEDDADGFVRWLAAQGRLAPGFEASFVPRRWYGDYLQAALDAARNAAGTPLRCHAAEVAELQPGADGGWRLQGPGLALEADAVVLCTGHPPPLAPARPPLGPRWVADVWADGALDPVGADERVAVIGTGATAIDAVLELWARGHRGPITMLSRRGLLPCVDVSLPAPDDGSIAPIAARLAAGLPLPLRPAMRLLRAQLRRAAAAGVPWQAVFDAFRAHVPLLWQGFDARDRRRFLRHVRPWWMVHRHRLAPDVAARLAQARADGRLAVHAVRLAGVREPGGGALELQLAPGRPPAAGAEPAPATLRCDWLLNCIGPAEDFDRVSSPLWRSLFDRGLVRPGPLGLGLDVDPQLRVLDGRGVAHPGLFAIGLATRGRFWEVTAVPHLRQQALAVARLITPPPPTGAGPLVTCSPPSGVLLP